MSASRSTHGHALAALYRPVSLFHSFMAMHRHRTAARPDVVDLPLAERGTGLVLPSHVALQRRGLVVADRVVVVPHKLLARGQLLGGDAETEARDDVGALRSGVLDDLSTAEPRQSRRHGLVVLLLHVLAQQRHVDMQLTGSRNHLEAQLGVGSGRRRVARKGAPVAAREDVLASHAAEAAVPLGLGRRGELVGRRHPAYTLWVSGTADRQLGTSAGACICFIRAGRANSVQGRQQSVPVMGAGDRIGGADDV